MKYTVTLVSKDNHTFVYTVKANSEDEAKQKALDHITELGWDMYKYKVIEVK